jgi:hypothetical protein
VAGRMLTTACSVTPSGLERLGGITVFGIVLTIVNILLRFDFYHNLSGGIDGACQRRTEPA